MSLAQQWKPIQAGLPADWGEARLSLRVDNERRLSRAIFLLGPLQPTRSGNELRFYASRQGTGPTPGSVERALERLDEERIRGALAVLETSEATIAPAPPAEQTLVEAWDAAAETLAPDWSDLYGEIELTSSDHLDPAAVAVAPLNPSRLDADPIFRFRCARRFGYGASAPMVRRCLARLDERGIPGELRILRVLSDTQPVGTQGPVWYVGGKVV